MLLYLCLLEKYSFPHAHFHISQMRTETGAGVYTNFHPSLRLNVGSKDTKSFSL